MGFDSSSRSAMVTGRRGGGLGERGIRVGGLILVKGIIGRRPGSCEAEDGPFSAKQGGGLNLGTSVETTLGKKGFLRETVGKLP